MISLQEITVKNYWECMQLKVKPEQERFVASNAVSLAQSKYQPDCVPLAVYSDETMVGFLMYLPSEKQNAYCIFRVMTGAEHQGKGYGAAAMELLLERFGVEGRYQKVLISLNPENSVAEHLYAKLGFYRNGDMWDSEMVMQIEVKALSHN